MKCRSCQHHLTHVFADLETSPPSNSFLSREELNRDEARYPLKVFVCDQCFLVQVDEYKKTETIFDQGYVYFSSFSSSWLEHAKNYVNMISRDLGLNEKSLVIEVASNDGYLLQNFVASHVPCLGVEPTKNTAEVARQKGIETITEFFGTKLAADLAGQGRYADLILGNNVLAHVPDIHDFVAGFGILLKPEGVVTLEFPYLVNLVEQNQFDTIYHEHFSYLSITALSHIFPKHELQLFKIEEIPTHGGSLRIYLKRSSSNRPIDSSVSKIIAREHSLGVNHIDYYRGFQDKCEHIKQEFTRFLLDQKKAGRKVAAYGAAAKGNTLLNYCGINTDLIDFVVDASPHKQSKFLPGSHIPVKNLDHLINERPDVIIILPWNLAGEISELLEESCQFDYQLVVAIPKLTILQKYILCAKN